MKSTTATCAYRVIYRDRVGSRRSTRVVATNIGNAMEAARAKCVIDTLLDVVFLGSSYGMPGHSW